MCETARAEACLRHATGNATGLDPSGSPCWRWFGPVSVLLAGIAFFVAAQTQKAAPLIIPLCGLAAVAPPAELPFLAENDAAMSRMMTQMTIQPTGDADRDFVAMMIPHHRGAIAMAQALLRHGRNEQLRRMAQEIIVIQQQEITAMQIAVGEPLPRPAAAPDRFAALYAVVSQPTWNR